MKILIQARKDGYNVLYPTPTTPAEFYQFASDIQSASANNDAIYYGKNFYSLAFASGGCIFTKYVIGYDILRNNLGNVGISVFIPNTQELSGNDVKILLDNLLKTYCSNYCPDNNIRDQREDWILFTSYANSYDAKLKSRSTYNDNVTTGTQDPAFHYYKSDSELIEHFDKPFQEEYSNYRQIFFIDSVLQSVSNPLNVIKNSGVELNPDLKNEYSYLNNYIRSKGVKITAYFNNKWNDRSDGKGNNQIRAKWPVEIKYSKDDRCYEPLNASGTISDLSSEIHKYIEIKGNQIIPQYNVFDTPIPIIKQIVFEIKDRIGNSLKDVEIQIGTRPLLKINQSPTTIDFQGEDIIKQWKISAKKESENLFSNTIPVTPDTQIGSVVLTLQKQIIVKIFAIDKENGNNISNFKFWSNDGKGYRENVKEIIFIKDEIDKTWNIEVSKNVGQDNYTGRIEYCPATGENPIYVPCQKKPNVPANKTYKIDAGEHGKKAEQCPQYSNSRSGNDLDKNCIIAQKGYVFKNWELINETLVAQYEKKKPFFRRHSGIAISVVSLLLLALIVWVSYSLYGKEKQSKDIPLTSQRITAYVEGDVINLDTLNYYKVKWKEQEPEIENIGGGITWYNPTTWFIDGNKANPDSTKFKEWDRSIQSIDEAITKRELINKKNIANLLKLRYFDEQLPFKTSIEKIDRSQFAEVGIVLGDVSVLTLSQIAKNINEYLAPEDPEDPEQPQEPYKENPHSLRPEQPKGQPTLQKPIPTVPPAKQAPATADITSEIIQYIKGSDLEKAELNDHKYTRGINQNLKNSIQLYNDFWNLVKSKDQKKDDYGDLLKRVKKDNILKSSELQVFLTSICASSDAFSTFKSVGGKAACESLTELKIKTKIQ